MKLKSVRDIEVNNKKVLMRVDYNVSLGKGLQIVDDTRIIHTLPTIKYLLERGCKVVLMAHLGRPKGEYDEKLSLRPVSKHLEELLGEKVGFVKIGESLGEERVTLLENLRFDPGEKSNSLEFAKKLARYGELYVNDAFGSSHRAHASVVGVTKILPGVAGLSMAKEVQVITEAVEKPKRPLVVIVGGAKVADKIQMLFKLVEKADTIIIGGGMANTFLLAEGYTMGKSFCEKDECGVAKELLDRARESKAKILLPIDVVVGNLETGKHNGAVKVDKIPAEMQALDIGPETQLEYGKAIEKAGTVIWNGPMGVFEEPQFAMGTDYIYHCLTKNSTAMVVVGGGDTLAAISKKEYLERINHISTGGGAMLELIEKGTLPGIEAIR